MDVLWKISLGRTIACGGLLEDPLTARDRILPATGEYPPIGFVPKPKEYMTQIVLDLGMLMITTPGLLSASLSMVRFGRY